MNAAKIVLAVNLKHSCSSQWPLFYDFWTATIHTVAQIQRCFKSLHVVIAVICDVCVCVIMALSRAQETKLQGKGITSSNGENVGYHIKVYCCYPSCAALEKYHRRAPGACASFLSWEMSNHSLWCNDRFRAVHMSSLIRSLLLNLA